MIEMHYWLTVHNNFDQPLLWNISWVLFNVFSPVEEAAPTSLNCNSIIRMRRSFEFHYAYLNYWNTVMPVRVISIRWGRDGGHVERVFERWKTWRRVETRCDIISLRRSFLCRYIFKGRPQRVNRECLILWLKVTRRRCHCCVWQSIFFSLNIIQWRRNCICRTSVRIQRVKLSQWWAWARWRMFCKKAQSLKQVGS